MRFWISFLFLMSVGCAADVGGRIEAPDVPAQASNGAALGFGTLAVSSVNVSDARNLYNEDDSQRDMVMPDENVEPNLEKALVQGLQSRQIAIDPGAPRRLQVDVQKWQNVNEAKLTSTLSSEASISVSVLGPQGDRLFSGTYQGSRESTFPLSSREDIKDSLGLAMSQAISGMLGDTDLMRALAGEAL